MKITDFIKIMIFYKLLKNKYINFDFDYLCTYFNLINNVLFHMKRKQIEI